MMPAPVSAGLVVKGEVQGVGFRWYAERIANSLGLKGFVRNLSDGDVEIKVEGTRDDIEELIERLKKDILGRNIISLKTNWEKYQGEFKDFRIRF